MILARFSLGLLVAGLLAACTSTPSTETGARKKEKDEEYVYRTSLGSRIPVKVRKSEAQTSEETSDRDQRWLSEAQERGVPAIRDPSGGR